MEELYHYELVDPHLVSENRKLLSKILFGFDLIEPKYTFRISPISGWIYFRDNQRILQENGSKELPKTELAIRKSAMQYIAAVQERGTKWLSNAGQLSAIGSIFPNSLELLSIEPVFSSGSSGKIDHWHCMFMPKLLISGSLGSRMAAVHGAGFDLRIGDKGAIEGLSLRWRQPVRRSSLPKIAVPTPEHTHSHALTTTDTAQEEAILFVNGGESTIQRYYSPMYLQLSGHHTIFTPATRLGIVCKFTIEFRNKNVLVVPLILGGSGSFSYQWLSWDTINPTSSAPVDHGTAANCRIPPGVRNVLLILKDNRTGNVIQKQEIIYQKGYVEESNLIQKRLGCVDPLASNYDPDATCDDGSCTYLIV